MSSAPPMRPSRSSNTAATIARIAGPPTSALPKSAISCGDRLRYVFRHRPIPGSDIARRAAELAERARSPEQFWDAHVALMTRSAMLDRGRPACGRQDLGLAREDPEQAEGSCPARQGARRCRCRQRPHQRRDDHPDLLHQPPPLRRPLGRELVCRAMLGTLGHRVRSAALDFASWGPSAGVLLLLATVLAVALTNSALGPWLRKPSGSATSAWRSAMPASRMTLRHWVNDGLLTIFFLVVGLEIKREFTVGHLASRRSAALPIAGGDRRHGRAGGVVRAGDSAGAVGAGLGRADGDRYRLRGGPDRDAGPARPGRAAHLPDRRGDRRRHRRDRRRGGLLLGRSAPRLSRRRRCDHRRVGAAQSLRTSTACRPTCC